MTSSSDEKSPRLFRLTLQSGEVVTLDTTSQGQPVPSQALVELLNSDRPSQKEFGDFITDVIPTIFASADPNGAIHREHKMGGMRLDLTYGIRNEESKGIVELLDPRHTQTINLEDTLRLVQDYANTLMHGASVQIAELQIIGGRDGVTMDPGVVEVESLPFEVHAISWDEVVRRIAVLEGDTPNPNKTILISLLIDASRKLLAELAKDHRLLLAINNRQLEEIVGVMLMDFGFTDVHLTQLGPDGGVDIHAVYVNRMTGVREYYIFQCKHQVTGQVVHLAIVTNLQQLVQELNADGGVVVASGGFGRRVLEQTAELEAKNVHLKSREGINEMIQVWQRVYGSVLFTQTDPISLLEIDNQSRKKKASPKK